MDYESLRLLAIGAYIASSLFLIFDYRREVNRLEATNKFLVSHVPRNRYAEYLNKEVLAKIYEQSDWERCVVIAVTWHGSVCVRTVADIETKGRWIHHGIERGRIKEIED